MHVRLAVGCICLMAASQIAHAQDAAEDASESFAAGKEVYLNQCAHCHGENGEGVADAYSLPLTGDRSVLELGKYVSEAMPDGSPEDCQGADAEAAAEYIWHAFYSEVAQYRNQPPRVELLHLTNRQYEESAADIFRRFMWWGKWSDERGLTVHFRAEKEKAEKVIGSVDVNWSTEGLLPENISAEACNSSWVGGLRSEATGVYEFTIESSGGFELFINNGERPIISALVRSGETAAETAAIKLLGGREYPIRIEFRHSKGEAGTFRLSWKPPHKTQTVVPPSHLSPGWFPEVFVSDTTFPPDDSSYGFERGAGVSQAWEEATTRAALQVAGFVNRHLRNMADLKETKGKERTEKLDEFYSRLTKIVLRGRFNDEEASALLERFFGKKNRSDEDAVTQFIVYLFKHPYFLYPRLGEDDSATSQANLLALYLWDSIPDHDLASFVSWHERLSEEEFREQAFRLVRDWRSYNKMSYFFSHWMHLDRAVDVSKDPERFPGFDRDLLSDLRTSIELFVKEVVESDEDDFRKLLQADYVWANQRMAEFYGLQDAEFGDPNEFKKLASKDQRAGIITHPYLLSGFAYHKTSSPIHRGVFLARKVLGRRLRPPPIAVAPTDEGIDPELTTRERVELQTEPVACSVCHTLINPLGFGLENFDAVGRFRLQERDKSINAKGEYFATSGEQIQFDGPKQLADFLSSHPDAHQAFVEHLFHHYVQQAPMAYSQFTGDELSAGFASNEFSIRLLLIEIMVRTAFTPQPEAS